MSNNKFSRRRNALSRQLIQRIILLSLIAVLGLILAGFIGLTNTLQAARRELNDAAVTSARTFDDFMGKVSRDLLLTGEALPLSKDTEAILRRVLKRQPAVFELLLLNQDGQVMAHRRRVGEVPMTLTEQPWLETVQDGEVYIGPVDYEDFGVPFIDIAVPVQDVEGNFWSTLLARVDLTSLWDMVIGLRVGETGYVYAADEDGKLLVYRDIQLVRQDVAVAELTGYNPRDIVQSGFNTYPGIGGKRVIGASERLDNAPWLVVVEQPVAEALRPFMRLTIGALFLLLIVGGVVYTTVRFTQRRIVSTLTTLRESVEILREGKLEHRIALPHQDELGHLADTFNTMAARLQEVISGLEQRVVERTRDLERRAVQLETAAHVARDAAAIRDVEQLLDETVHLISDKFGFYHAGIFLLDDTGEFAILEAASSEGGQNMLARRHKLKVGEVGIVGYVAGSGEPRIALDVGDDAVYFDNPDMPQTRSEIALPLEVRGEIIGVLDVQSVEAQAFDDEDISILRTMADQLALAIENAHLLEESRRAVQELKITQDEYTRTAWEGLETIPAFEYNRIAVTPVSPDLPPDLEEIEETLKTGQVIARTEPDNGNASLAAPLRLRDQIIGAITLEETDEARVWTEEEIDLVKTVGEQVALALENARLFQETQDLARRRALINEVLQAASTSLHPEDLLHESSETISRRLQIPSAMFLWEGEQNTLRPVAMHAPDGSDVHWPEGEQGITREMDPAIFEAIEAQEAILLENPEGELRGVTAALAQQLNIRSSIYTPMVARGKVLGAMQISRVEGQPPISSQEMTFADIIAANLSVGLENARLYQEALDTAERLKEVDQIKTQFLANMSHELRTPLNSIIGFSRVILKGIDGPLTDQQQEDLNAIYNSGQHLLGLINDILDISKIEAGKMELAFETVDLNELISGVLSTAIALVKDKPIKLQQSVPDNLPEIKADARRVRQVVLNLVSNAAKFTEEGFIHVQAEAGPEEVTISVADSGPGIPPDRLEDIFEPFTQADSTPSRKHGGTGLGLTISNSFVELHGGRMWVESEVDVGSTFYFTLPIEGPTEEEEISPDQEAEFPEADEDKLGNTVLCVDDDEGVVTLFRRYLRKRGYKVIGLTDATRVLEEAKRINPYAITLDVMMPEKDGWQIIKELKSDPETSHIPIVMCTIISEEEKGMSLGAADYLVKPILEQDLLTALDRLNQEAGRHQVLVVDDQRKDRELLRRIIESQEGYEVVEAKNGQEAIAFIRHTRPHIIILDLMMPGVDGFAVLEAVKADKATRSIPIIVVTAKDLTDEEKQMLNNRTETLVEKGVLEKEELLADVAAALRKIEQTSAHL